MENLIGKSFGRYHITDRLGEGGMASVFKAYDTNLERYVAIKVIRRDRDDDSFLRRFQREAKALAHLDHPYILKVLDYGEQDGMPYLVMPLVSGGTLKQSLTKAISYQQAAALLAPMARALEYAHKQGIIHRDIKPANILISHSGAPILSDFGVAKILEGGDTTQLTGTGVGIGTPDYMAPEQWMGQVDQRTDIYALGIVFFQMVTGKLPYTADTPAAVLLKHINDPLPQPKSFIPDLPDSVDQVIFKALAKEPEHRFQDMGTFAAALEALSRNEPLQIHSNETLPIAAPVKAPAPVQKPKKSNIWLWVGGIVLAVGGLVVACILLGGLVWFTQKEESSTATGVSVSNLQQETEEPERIPSETREAGVNLPTETLTVFVQPTPEEETPIQSIEGLPEDVPIIPDNNGDLTTTTAQEMNMYSFSSDLTADEVIDYYEIEMTNLGWELMATTTQEGAASLTFAKEDYSRMVMVNVSGDGDSTFISLMVVQQ